MADPLILNSLPLFPLGTVLFPGGLLPLQIFEVRYLDMIRKCHKAGAPFGVVSLTEGSEVRKPGASDQPGSYYASIFFLFRFNFSPVTLISQQLPMTKNLQRIISRGLTVC